MTRTTCMSSRMRWQSALYELNCLTIAVAGWAPSVDTRFASIGTACGYLWDLSTTLLDSWSGSPTDALCRRAYFPPCGFGRLLIAFLAEALRDSPFVFRHFVTSSLRHFVTRARAVPSSRARRVPPATRPEPRTAFRQSAPAGSAQRRFPAPPSESARW